MTDDAELRARIEARVAARRAAEDARSDSSDSSESSAAPAPEPSEGATGPRRLAPTRPWERTTSPGSLRPELPTDAEAPIDRGLTPTRPWLRRPLEPVNPLDLPGAADAGTGTSDAEQIVRPVRRWGPAASESTPGSGPGSRPRASNSDVVLQRLADEARTWTGAAAAQPPAEPAPAIDPEPVDPEPVAPIDEPDPGVEPESSRPPRQPAEAPPPWQRPDDDVDLDLKGAPTWDPGDYPPETEESGIKRRGRRAAKWMFARRADAADTAAQHDPDDVAGTAAPAPVTAGVPDGSTDSQPDRPAAGPVTVPATYEPVDEPEPAVHPEPVDEPEPADEPVPVVRAEPVDEPEPAVPAEPVDRTAPVSGTERAGRPEFVDEPEPAAESEPVVEPGPEAAPAAAPASAPAAHEPEPEPPMTEPVPPSTSPRPRPRPAGAAAAAPPPATRPRPRPRPGPPAAAGTSAVVADPPAAPAAPETYREATTRSRTYDPDLSRFLAASEPQDGDDEPERKPRRVGRRATASAAPVDLATRDTAAGTTAAPSTATPVAGPAPKKSGPSAGRRALTRVLGYRRTVFRYVLIIVIIVGAGFLLRQFVVAPYYIPSESMEPTLHGCMGCNDDRILVDKVSYRLHDPKVKDIVVFDRPPRAAAFGVTDKVLVKRVIAVGGDKVSLRNGLVYVNGGRLDEPYLNPKCGARASTPAPSANPTTRWTVPKDDLFVMGDNRCESADSRYFGPITTSSVIGRAWLIVWPLSRFGTID